MGDLDFLVDLPQLEHLELRYMPQVTAIPSLVAPLATVHLEALPITNLGFLSDSTDHLTCSTAEGVRGTEGCG